MPQFTDTKSRVWHLELSIGLALAIRAKLKVDFLNLLDGKALDAVSRSDETLVNVLWLICAEQAQAAGVDEVEFAMGLGGDALGEAIEALLEALVLFTRPDNRPAIQKVLAKVREVHGRQVQLAVRKCDSPAMEQTIQAHLRKVERQTDSRLQELTAQE